MNVLQTITLNMQSNFQKWDIERMVILPIFHYICHKSFSVKADYT